MTLLNRRNFLSLLGLGTVDRYLQHNKYDTAQAAANSSGGRIYQGSNLEGWPVVNGDGGTSNQGPQDIETIHLSDYSELRANIRNDSYMSAHNITYLEIVDANAFDFVHICEYDFRLPYLPQQGNTNLNAQTIEGGISLWDGSNTRLKYEVLFQWILNPYWRFGEVQSWTGAFDRLWQGVGELEPDTVWHRLRMVADFQKGTSHITIDGICFPSCIGRAQGLPEWADNTAAHIQAEIISLDPGDSGSGAMHKAHFKDWIWYWEPLNTCTIFLPTVMTASGN